METDYEQADPAVFSAPSYPPPSSSFPRFPVGALRTKGPGAVSVPSVSYANSEDFAAFSPSASGPFQYESGEEFPSAGPSYYSGPPSRSPVAVADSPFETRSPPPFSRLAGGSFPPSRAYPYEPAGSSSDHYDQQHFEHGFGI